MKKTKMVILRFPIAFIWIGCLLCALLLPAISEAKQADPYEEVWDNGEQAEVYRKKYGLVARDVAEVSVGTDTNFWEVYICQRNEKKVREVNFFKRVNNPLQEKEDSRSCSGGIIVKCKGLGISFHACISKGESQSIWYGILPE